MDQTGALSTAEKLREDGNSYFKKGRFGAAIDAYTEAITLCPNVAVYFTNRALCHLKRNDWTRVEEDSSKAIQLDFNCVKGHYMLGLALLQKQEYPEGVKELERALDLGRGADPKGYMVEEIWQELAKAKYMEWDEASSNRAWELQSLKQACESALKEKHDASQTEGLLDEAATNHMKQLEALGRVFEKAAEPGTASEVPDYLWELQSLKQACESALKEKHDASQTEGFLDEAATNHMKQVEALGRVFEKAAEPDTASEVPDYLCCNITLDIFRDPVITPSGVTYERSVILNHLETVGMFDPVTREPVEPSQLIPNFAIKEAVQAYLKDHGWAYRTW